MDGGAFAQVFLYPPPRHASARALARGSAWCGARLGHPQRAARSGMGGDRPAHGHIAGRAIATMIASAATTTWCGSTTPRSATASTTTWPIIGRDFTADLQRALRAGLHARAVRLRLPARNAGRRRTRRCRADPRRPRRRVLTRAAWNAAAW